MLNTKLTGLGALALVLAMTMTAEAQPPTFTDLGVIGPAGSFTFNTDNSIFDAASTTQGDVDTELGIWDSAGLLLAADDDGSAAPGFWSEITINLADGQYWLGSSEFDTIFGDLWVNTGTGFEAGEIGDMVLNIDGGFASQIEDVSEASFGEAGWWSVTVSSVPEPTSMAVLGIAGLGLLVRRRRS